MALITNLCIFISFCPLVQSYEAGERIFWIYFEKLMAKFRKESGRNDNILLDVRVLRLLTRHFRRLPAQFSQKPKIASISTDRTAGFHDSSSVNKNCPLQTHIYYQNKGKTPKLKRRVLEVMDKGGSILKKPNAKTKKSNSYSSLNAPPSE